MNCRAGAILLWVLAVSACAPKVVAPPAARLEVSADPAAVWAAVRGREQGIRTLRARFAAEFASNTDESLVRRATGVLLVKMPDRFRLRLLSPFGLTVFDYTSWGEQARIELPLEGKQLTGDDVEKGTPFSPALLRRHFLRTALDPAEQCTPDAHDADVIVSCRAADGTMQREIIIERRTGRVNRELTGFVDGHPQFVTTYEDYRPVTGLELPFAIRLGSAAQALRVNVSAYEVNPILPDSLFDPPVQAGSGP